MFVNLWPVITRWLWTLFDNSSWRFITEKLGQTQPNQAFRKPRTEHVFLYKSRGSPRPGSKLSTDSGVKSDELRRTVTALAHRLGHERQQPSSNNREQDMWTVIHRGPSQRCLDSFLFGGIHHSLAKVSPILWVSFITILKIEDNLTKPAIFKTESTETFEDLNQFDEKIDNPGDQDQIFFTSEVTRPELMHQRRVRRQRVEVYRFDTFFLHILREKIKAETSKKSFCKRNPANQQRARLPSRHEPWSESLPWYELRGVLCCTSSGNAKRKSCYGKQSIQLG